MDSDIPSSQLLNVKRFSSVHKTDKIAIERNKVHDAHAKHFKFKGKVFSQQVAKVPVDVPKKMPKETGGEKDPKDSAVKIAQVPQVGSVKMTFGDLQCGNWDNQISPHFKFSSSQDLTQATILNY